MTVLRLILAALFAASGIFFAALNADPVIIDFYFAQIELTVGISVLLALMLGALLGGLALAIGSALPARRKIRLARESGRAEGEVDRSGGSGPDRS